MAEKHHIKRIYDTRSNLGTELDIYQVAIETDNDKNLVYKDGAAAYRIVANLNEAATFDAITCDDLTIAVGHTITISDLTDESVLFVNASLEIAQDNTNFKWDDSNNRLEVANLRITSLSSGSVLFSDADGDVSEDNTNFTFNDSTNTLTIANLAISGLTANSVPYIGASSVVSENNTHFTWNNGTTTLSVPNMQVTNLSDGSVLFSDADGDIRQDNTNFFYDNFGNRLEVLEVRARTAAGLKLFEDGGTGVFVEDGGKVAIGFTSSLNAKLEARSTTEQLRLSYDGSNYVQFVVTSGGNLEVTPSGGVIDFVNPNDSDAVFSIDWDINENTGIILKESGGSSGIILMSAVAASTSPNYINSGYLAIGNTTMPAAALVWIEYASDGQLTLAYDGSNHTEFTTDSNGKLTIYPTGVDVIINSKLHVRSQDDADSEVIIDYDGSNDPALTMVDHNNVNQVFFSCNTSTDSFIKSSKFALGTNTATEQLTVEGNQQFTNGANRTIDVESTDAASANDLTIQAGSVTNAGEPDIGGDLILKAGDSTYRDGNLVISDVYDIDIDIANDMTFTSGDSFDITFESTDSGSSSGPSIELYRNSSSPAPNDYLGRINWWGKNDAATPETITYATLRGQIVDETDGDEDGLLECNVVIASSVTKIFTFEASGLLPANGATIHAIAQDGAPTSTTNGALWLDTNASANGDLMVYGNGAWRKVISLP